MKFFLQELSQTGEYSVPPSLPTVVQSVVLNLICPPNVIEITLLWDFLFLSHPASSTYLNYRIIGALDWLNSGKTDSNLGAYFHFFTFNPFFNFRNVF